MRGAASFVFRCARCSGTPAWVRGGRSSRRCPYRVAVPPVGGGAPPALGGRRAAPVAPQLGWVRGGGGGPPRSLSGLCGGGGGGVGGVLRFPGDAPCRPKRGGGEGGLAVPAPGASHRPGGSRPSPAPLISRPLQGVGLVWLGVLAAASGVWIVLSVQRALPRGRRSIYVRVMSPAFSCDCFQQCYEHNSVGRPTSSLQKKQPAADLPEPMPTPPWQKSPWISS